METETYSNITNALDQHVATAFTRRNELDEEIQKVETIEDAKELTARVWSCLDMLIKMKGGALKLASDLANELYDNDALPYPGDGLARVNHSADFTAKQLREFADTCDSLVGNKPEWSIVEWMNLVSLFGQALKPIATAMAYDAETLRNLWQVEVPTQSKH